MDIKIQRLIFSMERKEVVYRLTMNFKQRQEKLPLISRDVCKEEKEIIFNKLIAGQITEPEAMQEIKQLMDTYYGVTAEQDDLID